MHSMNLFSLSSPASRIIGPSNLTTSTVILSCCFNWASSLSSGDPLSMDSHFSRKAFIPFLFLLLPQSSCCTSPHKMTFPPSSALVIAALNSVLDAFCISSNTIHSPPGIDTPRTRSIGKLSTLVLWISCISIRSIASLAGAHQYLSLSAIAPLSNPSPAPPALTSGLECLTLEISPISTAIHATSIAVYVFPEPAPPWHTTTVLRGFVSAFIHSLCALDICVPFPWILLMRSCVIWRTASFIVLHDFSSLPAVFCAASSCISAATFFVLASV